MNQRTLRSDFLLFLTALIWGFAFVAQRMGMEHIGPFAFNGIRFALGALVILALMLFRNRARPRGNEHEGSARSGLVPGLIAGTVLFAGASLQQAGMVYTTAGNAGFITGLYVVLVPILGVFLTRSTDAGTWLGAVCAALGLYFLSIQGGLRISSGDLLVLIGAIFWAGHVLVIGHYSPGSDSLRLALWQYSVCAVLSLAVAWIKETTTVECVMKAGIPILYGGVMSVGVAYTLQIVGQKDAPSSHAAILMSLEAVFAAIGGWAVLDERLSPRQFFGCTLMLTGMLLSQLWRIRREKNPVSVKFINPSDR